MADLTLPVLMAQAALDGYPDAQKRIAVNTLARHCYRAGASTRRSRGWTRVSRRLVAASPTIGSSLPWLTTRRDTPKRRERWLEKTLAGNKDDLEVRILLREAEALLKRGERPTR